MNFSFAGCGFLGIYHVGVASCLRQHAPQLVENGILAGASAGAIVSCCLLCGCCLGECTTFTLRLATKARSRSLGPLHPSFNLVKILTDALNTVLPDNAHEIASGKLFISLTRVSDRKAVLVSQFDSKEELIQALLCSAHVPFYSGFFPPSFKGTRYVDGGLSDNLPILDENTVTVSPFAGESDICPTDNVSNFSHVHLANTSLQMSGNNLYRLTRVLFPCKPELLSDMCKQGFDDCLRFLQRNELITCSRHLTVKSSIVSVEESSPLSLISREDSSSEDEDIVEECGEDHCEDCKQKQKGALVDSLPPIVVEAFQSAMSKNFHSYVQQSRTLRFVGVLASPWTLPFDIVYNGMIRLLEYLPSLPQDAVVVYNEIVDVMRAISARISNRKRRYTARFTCQLAITEFNLNKKTTHLALPSNSPYEPQPTEPVVRNLNIGFAVDFDTKIGESLHTLGQLEGHMEKMNIDKISLESSYPGHNVVVSSDISNTKEGVLHNEEVFDTFEHCLHISNEMESVMAYYYKDENDKKCYNFEEIFDIDNTDINVPSPTKTIESDTTNHDLSWDSYLEMKPEVEQETEDFINEILSIPDFINKGHHDSNHNESTRGSIEKLSQSHSLNRNEGSPEKISKLSLSHHSSHSYSSPGNMDKMAQSNELNQSQSSPGNIERLALSQDSNHNHSYPGSMEKLAFSRSNSLIEEEESQMRPRSNSNKITFKKTSPSKNSSKGNFEPFRSKSISNVSGLSGSYSNITIGNLNISPKKGKSESFRSKSISGGLDKTCRSCMKKNLKSFSRSKSNTSVRF